MTPTMYLTGASGPATVAAAAIERRLGVLAQPGNALHRRGPDFERWGIDNGAYGVAFRCSKGKRGPWSDSDTVKYLLYLDKVRREVPDLSRCLFATAPDVLEFKDGWPVGDAEATWTRSLKIFPEIRKRGLPAALVAQDGFVAMVTAGRIDWDAFDVLFLGGSDRFKLGLEGRVAIKLAQQHGKWAHMGRVNGERRFRYAQSIGCDSADGTFIAFGPRKNLPKVLHWLASTRPPVIAAAAA